MDGLFGILLKRPPARLHIYTYAYTYILCCVCSSFFGAGFGVEAVERVGV